MATPVTPVKRAGPGRRVKGQTRGAPLVPRDVLERQPRERQPRRHVPRHERRGRLLAPDERGDEELHRLRVLVRASHLPRGRCTCPRTVAVVAPGARRGDFVPLDAPRPRLVRPHRSTRTSAMSLERRGDSRARSIDGPSPGPVPARAAPPSSSSTARDGEEHRPRRHLLGWPGALGKFGFFVTDSIRLQVGFTHGVPDFRLVAFVFASRIQRGRGP